MRVDTAIELIEQLVYKPEWKFEARDNGKRFKNSICIQITYPAMNSDRNQAPAYANPVNGGARASFNVALDGLSDVRLYGAICQLILEIEKHEMREFLRVKPTLWAPFHPHHNDGMEKWAMVMGLDPEFVKLTDYTFGLV